MAVALALALAAGLPGAAAAPPAGPSGRAAAAAGAGVPAQDGAGRATPADPAAGEPAPPTEAETAQVHAIAVQLRCVVCQALSVADSPSTTAQQMRAIILEQLRAGKSPEQVRAYFVSRYGEWVLLAPPRSGFNLIAWWLPFIAIALGVAGVLVAARRWVANGRAARGSITPDGTGSSAGGASAGGTSAPDRERLARELAGLER